MFALVGWYLMVPPSNYVLGTTQLNEKAPLQDIPAGQVISKIARMNCVLKSRGAVVCPSRIGAIADWVLGIIKRRK